jgi:hypothetical protein
MQFPTTDVEPMFYVVAAFMAGQRLDVRAVKNGRAANVPVDMSFERVGDLGPTPACPDPDESLDQDVSTFFDRLLVGAPSKCSPWSFGYSTNPSSPSAFRAMSSLYASPILVLNGSVACDQGPAVFFTSPNGPAASRVGSNPSCSFDAVLLDKGAKDAPVVRWTAPVSGLFHVRVWFFPDSPITNAGFAGQLLFNGQALFAPSANDNGPLLFETDMMIATNQTLDVTVVCKKHCVEVPVQFQVIAITDSPTSNPSNVPSTSPTANPTTQPSFAPTVGTTARPSAKPSVKPTMKPTMQPTAKPTMKPSAQPTARPSTQPTKLPSTKPSVKPTAQPSRSPTITTPTFSPSFAPTASPTLPYILANVTNITVPSRPYYGVTEFDYGTAFDGTTIRSRVSHLAPHQVHLTFNLPSAQASVLGAGLVAGETYAAVNVFVIYTSSWTMVSMKFQECPLNTTSSTAADAAGIVDVLSLSECTQVTIERSSIGADPDYQAVWDWFLAETNRGPGVSIGG